MFPLFKINADNAALFENKIETTFKFFTYFEKENGEF
jgi:hypothetical protein